MTSTIDVSRDTASLLTRARTILRTTLPEIRSRDHAETVLSCDADKLEQFAAALYLLRVESTPLSPKQHRAVELLRFFIKNTFEAGHGEGSWKDSYDHDLRQIVRDLTDVDFLSQVVRKRLGRSVRETQSENR